MSLGSVLKRIAKAPVKAAGAVGQAVQQAVEPPAPQAMDTSMPEYTPPAYQPMELPDIDPADPDAEHKTAVHAWIRELEKAHAEQAQSQGPEYHAQYEKLAKYAASQPQERAFDPISAFMIGMGSDEGLQDVKAHGLAVDKQKREREDYLLGLKEQAIKGNLQKLMEEGKFKQALTQSAALEELHATQDRIKSAREHKEKLKEIEETNKGKVQVANIRADAVVKTARERATGMAQSYKLTLQQMRSLDRQYGTVYNSYVSTHKDPLGMFNGDPAVLQSLWEDWQAAIVKLGEDLDGDGVPDSQEGKAPPAAGAPVVQPGAGGGEFVVLTRAGVSKRFAKAKEQAARAAGWQ